MDTVRALEHIHIFNGLSPDELNIIAKLSESKHYKANDLVFIERSKGLGYSGNEVRSLMKK